MKGQILTPQHINTQTPHKLMIIITGVGRCGTSLVAHLFKKLHINIGQCQYHEGINAGFEDATACAINNNLIKKKLIRDKNVNEQLNAIQQFNIPVFKDPRFLWDVELIKRWHRYHPHIKVIFLTRPAQQIAASQKRHPLMNTPAYRCFPDLIEKHEKEFEDNLRALKIPHIKTNVFEDPDLLLKTVHQWTGVKESVVRRKWGEIYDRSKLGQYLSPDMAKAVEEIEKHAKE